MFLNTREGQEEPPMEPGARWNIDPWVALPPLNPQRFTTPAPPHTRRRAASLRCLCLFFLWTGVRGPASITVTGATFPWASKIWVIPNFFPMIPVVKVCTLSSHPAKHRAGSSYELDLHF